MYIYIAAIIICVVFFLWINSNIIQISHYKVKSKKIPKEFNGYKIVQLSDLHNKEFGKNNQKLINKVEKLNPDIVIMTGDMIQKYVGNFEIAEKLIKKLSQKYKVYYSLGNHELEYSYYKLKELIKIINNAGATILKNENVEIKKGKSSIRLYGLNFKFNLKRGNSRENYPKVLQGILGGIDKSKYNILLAHDALNFEVYEKFGFDLIFSGHVHGGIIRFFGIGILSPRRQFFPKYTSGEYTLNKAKMIVSRGLGSSRVKIRVFNMPHINCVKLKSYN